MHACGLGEDAWNSTKVKDLEFEVYKTRKFHGACWVLHVINPNCSVPQYATLKARTGLVSVWTLGGMAHAG